jgi:hypothetical protein
MQSHRPERGAPPGESFSGIRIARKAPFRPRLEIENSPRRTKVRIFVAGIARYVPTDRIGCRPYLRDPSANANATWNENFIQYCKMQEWQGRSARSCFAQLARLPRRVFPGLAPAASQQGF